LPSWSNQHFKNQHRLATKIVSNHFYWAAATAVAWMPLDDWVQLSIRAIQKQRPTAQKVGSGTRSFSCTYFGERNWWVAAQSCNQKKG